MLLGALGVSQYTEKVDVIMAFGGRADTANRELRRMCHLMEGLAIAAGGTDCGVGASGTANGSARGNANGGKGGSAGVARRALLQMAFEAGRRYKVLHSLTHHCDVTAFLHVSLMQQGRNSDVAQLLYPLSWLLVRRQRTMPYSNCTFCTEAHL